MFLAPIGSTSCCIAELTAIYKAGNSTVKGCVR